MTDFSQKIASLSPEKRRLLELKLKEQQSKFNTFPASSGQRRLWFLHQLEPESPAYNIPATVRLKGSIDAAKLQSALDEMAHRHEVLRTTFIAIDGEPMQVVTPTQPVALRIRDFSNYPDATREEDALSSLQADGLQPFDLAKGPLFRCALYRLDENHHILMLCMHHIISDGWSIGIFIRELTLLYQSFVAGRSVSLPDLPIQYADYAKWQKKWLSDENFEKQLEFWKDYLGSNPAVLNLPTDFTRPALQSFHGAHLGYELDAVLSQAVQQLCQKNGVTPFMALLAVFGILLHRMSLQNEIYIGSPIANRNRKEIENLIGFFVNTLVFRIDLSGNPSFIEYLQRLKEAALNAFSHQDMPFEILVEKLEPTRDMSHTPLFQVMFNYDRATERTIRLPGLVIEPIEFESGATQFDLTFSVTEAADRFFCSIEYNTDLFAAQTAHRLLRQFKTLLQQVVLEPQKALAQLSPLTQEERTQVCLDWNDTQKHFAVVSGIQILFEEQVARTPDRIAVVDGSYKLTYRQLNNASNQLAAQLRLHGVGLESRVAFLLPRSTEMLITILAILKAGAAYIPIEPGYPADRVLTMLEDAKPCLVISRKTQKSVLESVQQKVLWLDQVELLPLTDLPNQPGVSHAESLAYIIYTSGSTGKPKGVQVEHRNLCNYVLHAVDNFSITAADQVLQFASISFDAAAEEIFPCLVAGATLVLREDDMINTPEQFLSRCSEQQITVLDLPTAYWHFLVSHMQINGLRMPPSVRLVIIGGERALPEAFQAWGSIGDSIRIVNTYGPTEATIVATSWDAEPNAIEFKRVKQVPIGRPVCNASAYVLDHLFHPVGIGMPGELCIGGAGVARGYLDRPDLTAEKFIPDPFSNAPDSRLYRTGDLVRFREDGDLEFLGRIDQQVKIRGFRIELGEIESVLQKHPGIADAVVTTWEDSPGDSYLAAYYVAQDHRSLEPDELRELLSSQLPDYMVPSHFIRLDLIPLTAQGKLNRKALPPPDGGTLLRSSEYVAPRTPQEEKLCDLYSQILRRDKIGIHDSFFSLGGHSLNGTQLISRIRDVFRKDLPLRVLFEAPTVAALAQRLEEGERKPLDTIPRIVPTPREGAIPLSFAQERLWFLDQLEPETPYYNIPTAVRVSGRLDPDALRTSLRALVQRHEILRTKIDAFEGQPHQVILEDLAIDVPVIDLSHLPPEQREAEAKQLMREDAIKPFNLSRAPLWRISLLRFGATDHLALLTMHHIISDGWSSSIFTRELAVLYNSFVAKKPSPLQELPLQYADYAQWQRSWLQGEVLQKEVDFWKHYLEGIPPLLKLPTDRPRPALQTFRGAHLAFTLPESVSHALRALCQKEQVTPFMALLAAYQVLLYRLSLQEDVCVGIPIANRNRSEIENVIGFFVNTLVLRTQFGGDPTFRQILRRVKENANQAYAHQDLPFEKVVDALQPERDLSHTPLFQTMFVFQNLPEEQIEFPDLVFSNLPVENNVAQFDLSLIVQWEGAILQGAFEYNTDLFNCDTIERMQGQFATLLQNIIFDPDKPVDELSLMNEEERRRLIYQWNQTDADYAKDQTLHNVFEHAAQSYPDAIALASDVGQLTFRELNERANQLAHLLRKQGVVIGERVGIALNRSPELYIGLIGILKAGAAYVPLDVNYPAERLAFMIKDSGIRFCVTKREDQSVLPRGGISTICLDDTDALVQESRDNPRITMDSQSPAYLIYTSGSTGQPKGVLLSHRSVLNHNFAMIEHFEIDAHDRVLQFASINFDAAVEEIFPTWFAGAALVMRPDSGILSSEELIQLIQKHHITVLDLPTAYWHEWVYEMTLLGLELPESVRLVIIGGEKASYERFLAWQKLSRGRVRLLNTYGPTETAIVSTLFDTQEVTEFGVWNDLPIGKPICNTRAYVLNKKLQPVPIGVPGELCIGGDGVALGYLNRPDLTMERFVADPFFSEPGRRMYRTGDLVRFLADGNIQYLGRVDEQVKIRGFRVEVGEIESVLSRHPSVREVAVQPRKYKQADYRLVGYVVLEQTNSPSASNMRAFLKTQLPDYMIPAIFVFLESLPRTPNGKIDRRKLPEPQVTAEDDALRTLPPRTEIESTLANIWAQVLGREQVSVNQNFFELGGDSILSIQVIAKASKAGLYFSPKQFFEHPTIADLAQIAGIKRNIHADQGPVSGNVPLTPIQHWFFSQHFSEPHHWNQSVLFEIPARLSSSLLEQAVHELFAHHDALRLRVNFPDSVPRQGNAAREEHQVFQVFDWSDKTDAELGALFKIQTHQIQASLDLANGPLARVVLFDLGLERSARLLIVAHHLVMDGVSWRILLEDLQFLYQQHESGHSPDLPAKTTSFQYWAKKLSEYASNPQLLQELAFWTSLPWDQVGKLPKDFDSTENSEFHAQSVSGQLSPEDTQALLQQIPGRFRVQINEVLLTALGRVLARWTGRQTTLVELEGHGREPLFDEVDTSRTVGWFTTIYPVLISANPSGAIHSDLKAVKEHLRAIPNQGIGFGVLSYLADSPVQEKIRELPMPEIGFNYLGQVDRRQTETGLFKPASEDKGPDRALGNHRNHLIEVTCIVVGGKMLIEFTFSDKIHRKATIERLARDFESALREIIAAREEDSASSFTPSDFPLAHLDQKKLDKVLGKLQTIQRVKK